MPILTVARVRLSTTLPIIVHRFTKKQLHTMREVDCVVKEKKVPFGPLPSSTGLTVLAMCPKRTF